MDCIRIKRRYNEAILAGEHCLTIPRIEITEQDMEEMRECGFNVTERDDPKKGKLVIITD